MAKAKFERTKPHCNIGRPHALPEGCAQILMIRILTCYDNFFTISCMLF